MVVSTTEAEEQDIRQQWLGVPSCLGLQVSCCQGNPGSKN